MVGVRSFFFKILFLFAITAFYPAQSITTPPLHFVTFTQQGSLGLFIYNGYESGLEAAFESFFNAHSGSCGTIDATVDVAANIIDWQWQNCGQANKGYNETLCFAGFTYNSSTQLCESNTDPRTDKNLGNCPEGSCCVGNPINPGVGNKLHVEVDYQGSGPFPIEFIRTYNSETQFTGKDLGKNWRHNYSHSIDLLEESGVSTASVNRPDGKIHYFTKNGSSWDAEADVIETLIQLTDGGGNPIGWELTNRDDVVETYDVDGKLITLTNRQGLTQTLGYDSSDNLTSVTGPFGRTLTFTRNNTNWIEDITDPDSNVYSYTYDNANNITTIDYPDSTSKTYHYEIIAYPYALTGITDENGVRFSTYDYDSQGRAISTEHAGAVNKYSFVYNTNGTTTVTDPLGEVRTYDYDTSFGVQRNTTITGSQCSSCGAPTKTYDANGFLASSTDWNGNVTTFIYNSRGLQISRTEASGTSEARTITTDWHASFRLPTKITETDKETTFTYNSTGQLLTRTEKDLVSTDSRTTTFTYDSNGQILTINGPRTDVDDITTFTYDALSGNRLTMSVDPDGAGSAPAHVTQYTSYDLSGRLLSMTDPNGAVTSMTYDARGRLKTRTIAGSITTFDYDDAGNVSKITLPDSSYLSYTYDDAQRLTDITDSLGNKISYTLDAIGNRTNEDVFDSTTVLRRTQSRVFDQLNRMTESMGGANQITYYAYDANGNQITVTNPLNRSTSSQYDALDRLIQTTDHDNFDTDYAYDERDNLISVTDARNLATTYTYDGLENLTELDSPDTGITTYTYDDAGNRLTQTDARNITATYSYDALNRLTSISYPDTSLNVTYTYDQGTNGVGRLTQMMDDSGTTDYTYDARGNLLSESKSISGQTYVTSYTYNAADNLTQITYPSGRTVENVYNSAGQVIQVNTTLGANTNIVASSISYQPFGPIDNFILGNGLTTTNTYDQDYRLTDTLTSNSIQSLSYGYDLANNITAITNNNDATRNQTFTYDNIDRLLTANGIYGALSYTYDGVGNRLTETVGSNTDTYSYSSSSNQLQNITGTQLSTFTYDTIGNITNAGGDIITVNDANRMASISTGSTSGSYTYNGNGERVVKVSGTTTTIYHFDQSGNFIAESDALGNVNQEYIYLNGQRLATIDPNGTGTGGSTEIIVDNSNAGLTSSTGTWTTTVTGTGDYEGANVALSSTSAGTELFFDDNDPQVTTVGSWLTGGPHAQFYGTNLKGRYSFSGVGNDVFTWGLSSISSGTYEVYANWVQYSGYASNAPYTINHTQGSDCIGQSNC